MKDTRKTSCYSSGWFYGVVVVLAMAHPFHLFGGFDSLSYTTYIFWVLGSVSFVCVLWVLYSEWRSRFYGRAEAAKSNEMIVFPTASEIVQEWWSNRCFESKALFLCFTLVVVLHVADMYSGAIFVVNDDYGEKVRLKTWTYWGLHKEVFLIHYSNADHVWKFDKDGMPVFWSEFFCKTGLD